MYIMKLPNGYGSVYKLSGRRRKPWCARKTIGWKKSENTNKQYPIYKFIGYYMTKHEAFQALENYNINYDQKNYEKITLEALYIKWSDFHFQSVSKSYITCANAAWKVCYPIKEKPIDFLKPEDFQNVFNTSGKNTPTLNMTKNILGLMYDYAIMCDMLPNSKRDIIRYLDTSRAGNPNSIRRQPFSKTEIQLLWDKSNQNEYISTVLILIYTGLRIGELLGLKSSDINLQEHSITIRKSKTISGVRTVPIATKILPLIKQWKNKKTLYLITSITKKRLSYQNYINSYWHPLMYQLQFNHRPHDTRHTCITLLTEANVDQRIIRQIVGHKGDSLTENIYTHIDIYKKLEAINKI